MLQGANHVLVPSSKYWVPVLIREGDELGQGIGNKTLISRWPLEVSSQQVFKIKRRRRSLNRKCEKMGIPRMTWSQHVCIPYRVGLGFQVALLRSPVCDSL